MIFLNILYYFHIIHKLTWNLVLRIVLEYLVYFQAIFLLEL